MRRRTDAEIRKQSEELAALLIKSGLSNSGALRRAVGVEADRPADPLVETQLTQDTQELMEAGTAPGETLEILDACNPITGYILRGDPASYNSASAYLSEPEIRGGHLEGFGPKGPGPVLIRESRVPVTIVLHFQAFAISSDGDLLQSKGRNEWALVDLSEPSEALTHDIISALKLCPLLPTVFCFVTAENVQAIFRAFAAGFNHSTEKKVVEPKSRSAGCSAGGDEPMQPKGRQGMTWKGVALGLLSLLSDRSQDQLLRHWQRSAVMNAVDLIIANHVKEGELRAGEAGYVAPKTEEVPPAVMNAALEEIRHG